MISTDELIQLEQLARKFQVTLKRRGAPQSLLRFTEEIERAVHWYEFNKKEKMK